MTEKKKPDGEQIPPAKPDPGKPTPTPQLDDGGGTGDPPAPPGPKP